jgi:hypothetical protein
VIASESIGKWAGYMVILYIAGALSGIAHEYGHFLVERAFGNYPRISFKAGRVETYDAAGNTVEDRTPVHKLASSAGGPAMTMVLAAGFTLLYLKRRDSFLLFSFAIMNAVMRLNMFVDGFNSDEGNMSEILIKLLGNQGAFLIPLTEWTIFVGLSCLLLRRQSFFKRTYWFIPLFFLVGAVSMLSSFAILGHFLG